MATAHGGEAWVPASSAFGLIVRGLARVQERASDSYLLVITPAGEAEAARLRAGSAA